MLHDYPRWKKGDRLFAHVEKIWATFLEYRCAGYGPDNKFALVIEDCSTYESTWYVYDLIAMG